jgi:hypothetical protein
MKSYRKWAKEHNQHGNLAFARFVMLDFIEAISECSDDFVFKGGNLLWHYIKTPRGTVDLDLTTITDKSHDEVRDVLNRACNIREDINYKVLEFVEVERDEIKAAKVIVAFELDSGQKNKFGLDIVYALPTDINRVKSTISNKEILSASIENIIADKVSASLKHRGGNTRMKDFDDLIRIARSNEVIDTKKLSEIFLKRSLQYYIEKDWASFMEQRWLEHAKFYGDLPQGIYAVFDEINKWLIKLK